MAQTEYNFTLTKQVGKWTAHVDPVQGYGYFEHEVHGEGGGLWFGEGELVDYDGVYCLPREVGTALESFGYTVSEDNY